MMDKLDVDGYSYDYRGNPNEPVFDYGFDPTDPTGWTCPRSACARTRSTNDFDTGQLDFKWLIGPIRSP